MDIDINTVKKIAKLANLELQPEEHNKYAEELTSVLNWIETLQKVDTEGSSSDWVNNSTPFREDVVTSGNIQSEVLRNTNAKHGCFVTPKVVE